MPSTDWLTPASWTRKIARTPKTMTHPIDQTKLAMLEHYRRRLANAPDVERPHLLKRIRFHGAVIRRPYAERLLTLLVNSKSPAAAELFQKVCQ